MSNQYTPPSGLSLKHYQTIAEREGYRLVELDPDTPIQSGDILDWLNGIYDKLDQASTSLSVINKDSTLVGKSRKQMFPNKLNRIWRLVQ